MITTMAEPEWDDATREAVFALDLYQSSLCPLCNRPAHICQDPAHQFDWITPPPVRCHATTAQLAQQRGYTEDTHPQHEALLFGVQLREADAGG